MFPVANMERYLAEACAGIRKSLVGSRDRCSGAARSSWRGNYLAEFGRSHGPTFFTLNL